MPKSNNIKRRAALLIKKLKLASRRITLKGKLVLSGFALLLVTGILLAILLPARARRASKNTVDISQAAAAAFVEITPNATIAAPTPLPTPTPTLDPTLKKGVEDERVQQLQERLMELGYLDLDESTQLYGSATKAAVQLFQRQAVFEGNKEIVQDGVAGVITLALIYSDTAPKYVVKEGMEGDDISMMQQQLKDLGYMSQTTGYYGELTIAAIQKFQSRNSLDVDGLAGEQTVEMLYSPEARVSATKANEARSKANISKMLEVAKEQLGKRYILGKQGPSTFDCSGLVYYCLKQAGSNRTRYNAAGYSRVSDWEKITSMSKLKKGDLIFFYDNNFTKVGHVGIVVSSGMMIDASSSNGKVVRRSFTTSYWKKHFVCGRRPW